MNNSNEMLSQFNAIMRDNPEFLTQLRACTNVEEAAQLITLIGKQGHISNSNKSVETVNSPDLTDAQIESVTGGLSGEDVLMGFAKVFFVGVAAVAGVAEVVSPGTGKKLIQDVLDHKFSHEK